MPTDIQRKHIYEQFIENPGQNAGSDPTWNFFSQNATLPPPHPQAHQVPIQAEPVTRERTTIHHHHTHHDSGIPWWALCFLGGNHQTNNYYGATPDTENRRQSSNQNIEFRGWMISVVIAGVVTMPAIGGAVYLFSELWNNLERFYYNEDYLLATLGLINLITSLCLATLLTNMVLSTALTALTVSAGFAHPVAWAFFILGSVTLFGAALIHYGIQQLIHREIAVSYAEALHPAEPGRFTITQEQINDMGSKARHLDRDKMQNVITAIHHDMTEYPSRTQRIFGFSPLFRSAETSEKLNQIRQLRTEGSVNYQTTINAGNPDRVARTLHFQNQSISNY